MAGRRLIQAPLFTTFAVASLAIGLGVTTAVYSILYSLLWAPSGVRDPDQVVVLKAPWISSAPLWRGVVSPGDAEVLVRAQSSVESIESSIPFAGVLVDAEVSKSVRGEAVTAGFLQVLGITATIGRPLQPADDHPGASAVVVLSHRFWRAALAGDPSVVGRTVRLGGEPFVVVGMVLRQGLAPVAEGLVIGLVVGTACEIVLRSTGGPIDAPLAILDPTVLVSVVAPPLVAGLVACYFPAVRASRANPVVALKEL